ncbi:uncharacterized protein TrAtP1_013338 [Trichoderma atroviride]|uniref:uncharacterized protein n=1 Tax=Hypocrea atroviridis TaxID=63577 RepID=UPI0033219A4F|nr:hypothetical protein TrAtP1_013338 [Trichoderma atroviride]
MQLLIQGGCVREDVCKGRELLFLSFLLSLFFFSQINQNKLVVIPRFVCVYLRVCVCVCWGPRKSSKLFFFSF